MARRLDKTLVDYLVIAISPALIITLIGSLVFFLLEVFYQGRYEIRLHVIFGLFVVAAVLIGRIAIEEGKERAGLFAAPLAIVTLLALGRYVKFQGGFSMLINLALIALIWWCAHKLTWDCTLIDEAERDTGEGLLESAGLDKPATSDSPSGDSPSGNGQPEPEQVPPEGTTSRDGPSRDGPALTWWDRLGERQRRAHAPGVWVVYFSLAALPLFGVGQMWVPPDGRQRAFNLLFVYVASGLGLLLSTSFLGLRRYLRQRRVEMPPAMANLWLLIGGALAVVLLVLVSFLPRPDAADSVSQLPFTVGSPDRQPSRAAVGRDGVEDEDQDSVTFKPGADRESEGPPQSQPGGKPAEGSSPSGDKGSSEEKGSSEDQGSGQGDSEDESSDQASSDPSQNTSEQDAADRSEDSKAPMKPGEQPTGGADRQPPSRAGDWLGRATAMLATLVKWVFYSAVILVVAFVLWRSRAELLAAVRDFLQGWREFWQRLFGGKRTPTHGTQPDDARPKQPSRRPFADFADPFATGMAGRCSAEELVRYSFEALEAWAGEHGCPRDPDQTPHEFAREVGERSEPLSRPAQRLADLYCRAAYARDTLPAENTDHLKRLWRRLQRSATPMGADVGQ